MGDRSAFNEIYSAYRPGVFSFLSRFCGERNLAEDLLQETWLRLADQAPQLRADTHLKAWLFTVARNLFISHRRRHRFWIDGVDDLCDDIRVSAAEWISPFDLTAVSEAERALERALAALPISLREVLLMVGVEQLEIGQVAEALHLSADAVRQRLSRARSKLAELMSANEKKEIVI